MGMGIHIGEMRAIAVAKAPKAAQLNAKREALKRELVEMTPQVNEAFDDLYRTLSGFTDVLVGALGKGSPAARNLQRLRSRIRQPGDQTRAARRRAGAGGQAVVALTPPRRVPRGFHLVSLRGA